MAREFSLYNPDLAPPGTTGIYVTIQNALDIRKFWYESGAVLESYDVNHYDDSIASGTGYARGVSPDVSGWFYYADAPALPAGVYVIIWRLKVGANPVLADDTVIGRQARFVWNGTAEVFQTGDSFARIGAAGAGLTAVDDATLAAMAALNNLSSTQVTAAVPTAAAIATAVFGATIWTGWTFTRLLKNLAAVALGKLSGLTSGAGTAVYRDVLDSTNQVTGDVDSHGNRTSVTPGS